MIQDGCVGALRRLEKRSRLAVACCLPWRQEQLLPPACTFFNAPRGETPCFIPGLAAATLHTPAANFRPLSYTRALSDQVAWPCAASSTLVGASGGRCPSRRPLSRQLLPPVRKAGSPPTCAFSESTSIDVGPGGAGMTCRVVHGVSVLRYGLSLRIGVPKLTRYVPSRQASGPLLEEGRPGLAAPALAFCEPFYRHGHRSMYDFDTLRALCLEAGFAQVHHSAFGRGRIQPCPDTPARRPETLYVEALA